MWQKLKYNDVYSVEKPDGYSVSIQPFDDHVNWSIYAHFGNKKVASGTFMVESFGDQTVDLAKRTALQVYEEIVHWHKMEKRDPMYFVNPPEPEPEEKHKYVPVRVGRGTAVHAAEVVTDEDRSRFYVFCGANRCTTGQRWPSRVHSMIGSQVTCKRCIKNATGYDGAKEALRIED